MTLDKLWDPSKYDDFHVSVEQKLRQMPSTPIDVRDKFYDLRLAEQKPAHHFWRATKRAQTRC